MPWTVREGTLRRVTPRPPIRLPDPGRTWTVVTPPILAVLKPGSWGQTECSAQTWGVVGLVSSLPSECAATEGEA